MLRQLFLLGLVFFFLESYATSFSFRVQCTKNGSPNMLKVFNRIPERQSYILPSGHTMYFSGGYFMSYSQAKRRLDEVHEKGIDEAFIRVFKNRMYLSDKVSANVLKALLMDYDQLMKTDSAKIKKHQEQQVRVKKKKEYTREEFEALKKQKKYMKFIDSDDPRKKEEKKKMGNQPKQSFKKKPKKEKEKLERLIKPSYRIQVCRVAQGQQLDYDLSKLDEIVYENKIGNKVAYTLGHFESASAAERALTTYKKQAGNEKFKVVGLYHGSLISKKLAIQIHKEYEAVDKNKKK